MESVCGRNCKAHHVNVLLSLHSKSSELLWESSKVSSMKGGCLILLAENNVPNHGSVFYPPIMSQKRLQIRNDIPFLLG